MRASVLAQGEVVARRYRLVERIGEGGMGEVWRAEENGGRPVALKFIRPEIAAHSDQAYERFEREARSARAVRHTNVIDVLDYGMSEDGTPYLAMEYLEGQGLERLFEQKPPPTIGEVVTHIAAALGGLAAIHERGIVHRDLKPSNIFLARNGAGDAVTPKLLDFGIARETGFDGQSPKTLTRTGEALGTPHYMSPEQIRAAKTVDHRSDIYSMGVILYEALAGRRPFDGPSPAAVIAAIVTRDSPPLQSLCADASPALVAVVDRALAYDADERFQSALEMKRALVAGGGGSGGRVAPREARSRESLESADTVASGRPAAPGAAVSTARPAPRPRTRRAFLSTLFAVGSVGTAGLAALVLYFGTLGGDPATVPEQSGGGGTSEDDIPANDIPPDETDRGLPVGRGRAQLGPAQLAELALAWRDLPADERDAGDWRFVPVGNGRYRASRIERSSGALQPIFLRTTSRLNVRAGPSADDELVRTLPVGTLVVGLYGDFGGAPSHGGSTGNWTRTFATPDDEGWCASRYLEATSGCIPSAAPALSAIPEERHDVVRGSLLFSRARVRRSGAPVDAVLTVGRDEPQSTSYVAVHLREEDGCNISSLTSIAVRGFVEEVFVVDTAPDGGETLLVIGWHPNRTPERGGAERWSVYTLGQGEMVWEGSFPTSESLPRRQRAAVIGPETDGPDGREGYYPLVIRRADDTRVHYVWDGRTLVAAPGAAPPGRAN